MEELEVKYVDTKRYGIIRFVKTEKGWTYQYDETLVMSVDMQEDDPPYYLDEEAVASEIYIPELECLNDDCFFETYEEAYEDMLSYMSNNFHLGLIC
jgi:hypothetical protein